MHLRRIITTTLAATTIAVGAGLGAAGAVHAGSLSVGDPAPSIGGYRTPEPRVQPATTCEGNKPCATLRWACELVGGTYSGWQSSDPGHAHEHGVCTWPWE